MKRLPFADLRNRLLLIFLLAVIPSLSLVLYRNAEQERLLTRSAQESTVLLARFFAANQDGLVDDARRLLTALGDLPEVRANAADCVPILAAVLRRYPQYVNLAVADNAGNVTCSVVPLNAPINVSDQPQFRQALDSRTFSVGDYQIGKLTHKALLPLAYPILDSSQQPQAVVLTGLDLAWLNQGIANTNLPENAVLTLVHQSGVILAYYPEPLKWTGQSIVETDLFKAISTAEAEGSIDSQDIDGVLRHYAFIRLKSSPQSGILYVAVGFPNDFLYAQVYQTRTRNLLQLAAIAALALAASWLGGGLVVVRPVDKLLASTRRIADGDLKVRMGPPYESGVLGNLAQGLDNMASALQRRTSDLQEAEARFRALVEATPAAIFLVGVHAGGSAKLEYMSPQIETLTGYTSQEFIGNPAYQQIHPEDRQAIIEQMDHMIQTGEPIHVEHRRIRRDGSILWVRMDVVAVKNEHGRSTHLQGLILEITQQKQAEEALRASEERFRNIVNTAHEGIWILDAEARTVYANKRVAELFGCTPEDMNGLSMYDFVDTANRAEAEQHFERRKQGVREDYDLPFKRKDGSILYALVATNPLYDGAGQFTGTLKMITDISERKRAEEERTKLLTLEQLARAEAETGNQRMTFLLEASILIAESYDYESRLEQLARLTVPRIADWCAIEILGEDGVLQRVAVIHTDPAKIALAFEIQRRYPPDPDVPRGTYQVLRTGQPEFYPDIPDALLEASVTDKEQLAMIRKLGMRSAMTVPLLAHGHVLGALTLVMAESERRFDADDLALGQDLARRAALLIEGARLYREVQRSNAELEQRVEARTTQLEAANKELEAFSYSVSHDLRAPLRAVSGFARILEEDYRAVLPPESIEYVDLIRQNAVQMGNLIDELLRFSRLGRQNLVLHNVDMAALARSVISDLSATTETAPEFTVSDLSPSRGDSALLKQVFVNLIGNAIKFTRNSPIPRVEIGSQQSAEGQNVYYVKDNGVGFDMRYVNKLFGVFQRLHLAEDYEGTGVGLAIVQRIIQRHGGRAWAEGELNKGATFYFTLAEGGQNGS